MVILFFLLLAIRGGAPAVVKGLTRSVRQNDWFLGAPMLPEGQVDG